MSGLRSILERHLRTPEVDEVMADPDLRTLGRAALLDLLLSTSAPETPEDEPRAPEPACELCAECRFACVVPGLDVCYACLADLGGEAGA